MAVQQPPEAREPGWGRRYSYAALIALVAFMSGAVFTVGVEHARDGHKGPTCTTVMDSAHASGKRLSDDAHRDAHILIENGIQLAEFLEALEKAKASPSPMASCVVACYREEHSIMREVAELKKANATPEKVS